MEFKAHFVSENIPQQNLELNHKITTNELDDAEIAFQLQLAELASDNNEVRRTANPTTGCYTELLELEDTDYVPNYEPFNCPICFANIDAIEGVWLRNCHHKFCKECIANVIRHSDEAEIKCPFVGDDIKCDFLMTDREIRALISSGQYTEHLQKSLLVAERSAANSFHCRTLNCKGFCFFENGINVFDCSVCKAENCLVCSVRNAIFFQTFN